MFECCPKRMEKFLKEAWVSLPAKGAGREPGTELAGGEESRTPPQERRKILVDSSTKRQKGGALNYYSCSCQERKKELGRR